MARPCGMFTAKRYDRSYTNVTSPFRIRWFVVRVRPYAFPWTGEALHATPLRRYPLFWCGATKPRRTSKGTCAGAAGPRPPAATLACGRTHGKHMRKGHGETVLYDSSIKTSPSIPPIGSLCGIMVTVQVGWLSGVVPCPEVLFRPVALWRLCRHNGPKPGCGGRRPPRNP